VQQQRKPVNFLFCPSWPMTIISPMFFVTSLHMQVGSLQISILFSLDWKKGR